LPNLLVAGTNEKYRSFGVYGYEAFKLTMNGSQQNCKGDFCDDIGTSSKVFYSRKDSFILSKAGLQSKYRPFFLDTNQATWFSIRVADGNGGLRCLVKM